MTNKKRPTRKQKEFARIIGTEPKVSATEAYKRAYNTEGYTNENAIQHEASRTLRNPSVQTELAKYNKLAENTIINTINDYKDSEDIRERTLATDTAKWVHDKTHGKAIQKQEVTTRSLSFNIDLSKGLEDLKEHELDQEPITPQEQPNSSATS